MGFTSQSSASIDDTIDQAAINNGLQPDYFRGLLKRESSFDPNAVNDRTGAMGLGQVLPSTAANPGYGIAPLTNPYDPTANINFSAAYLAARVNAAPNANAGVTGYSGGEYGAAGVTPVGRADGQPTGGSSASSPDAFGGAGVATQTANPIPGMTTLAVDPNAVDTQTGAVNQAFNNGMDPDTNGPLGGLSYQYAAPTAANPTGVTVPNPVSSLPSIPSIPSVSGALASLNLHDWFRRGALGLLGLSMLIIAFVAFTRKS